MAGSWEDPIGKMRRAGTRPTAAGLSQSPRHMRSCEGWSKDLGFCCSGSCLLFLQPGNHLLVLVLAAASCGNHLCGFPFFFPHCLLQHGWKGGLSGTSTSPRSKWGEGQISPLRC